MKLFSLEEANSMLPELSKKLVRIRQLYSDVAEMREQATAAASASEFGGGMKGGSGYVRSLYEIGKITTEINAAGVQLKDYTRGLIDFPAIIGGKEVFLCWEQDEDDIEFWHDLDTGYAERERLS